MVDIIPVGGQTLQIPSLHWLLYCPLIASVLFFFSPLDIHWSAILLYLERKREMHGSFSLSCVSHPLAFFTRLQLCFLFIRRGVAYSTQNAGLLLLGSGKVTPSPSAGRRKDCTLVVQRCRVTVSSKSVFTSDGNDFHFLPFKQNILKYTRQRAAGVNILDSLEVEPLRFQPPCRSVLTVHPLNPLKHTRPLWVPKVSVLKQT